MGLLLLLWLCLPMVLPCVLRTVSMMIVLPPLVLGFSPKLPRSGRSFQRHDRRTRTIHGFERCLNRARTTNTCRNMFDDVDDPDMLLELVEDLLREETTPETLAEMEAVEVALSQFLDEKNAALFEQEETRDDEEEDFDDDDDDENQDAYEIELQDLLKPPPPLMPPPGALLDSEEDQLQRWQQQERDLTKALESLRQRLWQDDDDDDEYDYDYDYEEDEIDDDNDDEPFQSSSSLEEQDILQQAEEALRKSREAAERRKQEAKRRSVSAAKVSGGYRQPSDDDNDDEEDDLFGRSVGENNNGAKNKKRPTIQLGSLFGKRATSNDIYGDKTYLEERNARAPKGLPILYDWVQDEEGSITGKIRRSVNFSDGATISTSSVALGARGGTIVSTESGSRYYLDLRQGEEQVEDDNNARSQSIFTILGDKNRPVAPAGVPTVKSWEVRQGGGIIGLIYGCPDADDGDYIETSPIVQGTIDNFSVVATESGSRYFLSGDPPDNVLDTLSAFRDEITGNRRRRQEDGTQQGERKPPSKPRPTFSLFDLFANDRNGSRNESPSQQSTPPSPTAMGTPTLTGCVFNDDGSITGYVFGSPTHEDGRLITTSPIVDGYKKQFETVTTATGSIYFLG